ncbi:MAG TPA: hypothetical protein DCO68_10195 [Methylophilaceae bacterium]|nr:hypothetical protein [Methylophilaceae bacterium]
MNTDKNLPVDMIIVEPTVVEGVHLAKGEVINKCPTELAMDLAGSGKARPATPELIAQYSKPTKSKGKNAPDTEKANTDLDANKTE